MFDIHQPICDTHTGDLDEDRLDAYVNGVMAEFAESPEADLFSEQHESIGWSAMFMEHAAQYFAKTVAALTVSEFREFLFGIVPRKVSTEPHAAAEIVAELRAFWRYLQRVYDLPSAAKMLRVLNDDAAERLHEELSDPANFGMAKSLFMIASKAGFDMTSERGLQEFTTAFNSGLFNAPISDEPQPVDLSPGAVFGMASFGHESRKHKRKKAKAQRQARKRNRRR